MTDTEDPMTAALRAVNFQERYAALRDREIDFDIPSLDPDEFAVALRATGRDFDVPSWYQATLSGSDDGRPYELWARFHVQSNAHEVEFGVAATTPHVPGMGGRRPTTPAPIEPAPSAGRIGGLLEDLAWPSPEGWQRPLPFRTRDQLDDVVALALDVLDRLRAVAADAAPTAAAPIGDPLLAALAAVDFGRRYFALCDIDVGEPEPTPDQSRQRAALLAAGFEPTYEPQDDFYACRLAGAERAPGPEIVVNVIVRYTRVELTAALRTPDGQTGMTFHVAARELMERSVPAWRHDPPYPLVPFGARRPFEATIGDIAALVRDVHAALAGSGR